MDRGVVVFTKPARPGTVKTRLIGELSPADAADLHNAFLHDLMEALQDGNFDLMVAWALESGEALPGVFDREVRQKGSSLGERLYLTLAEQALRFQAVMAVGSDHPELPPAVVEQGFEQLERGADVVLGPAEDGGYYLLGLSSKVLSPGLFSGVEWSTREVLRQTLDNCGALGLEVELLPPAADVDTPADLARLARRLAGDGGSCPRTRAILAEWGWMEVGP